MTTACQQTIMQTNMATSWFVVVVVVVVVVQHGLVTSVLFYVV